jgi:hypothetical protein
MHGISTGTSAAAAKSVELPGPPAIMPLSWHPSRKSTDASF